MPTLPRTLALRGLEREDNYSARGHFLEIDTTSLCPYNTLNRVPFSNLLFAPFRGFRMIVKGLLDIQERYGYLPQEELEFLALRAAVPLYRVQELTTFFPHFRREKPPEVTVHICQTMTCHLRGAPVLVESARKLAEQHPGKLEVCAVSCLGRCDRAPVALVSRHSHTSPSFHDYMYTGLTQTLKLQQLLESAISGHQLPAPDHDKHEKSAPPAWRIDLYDARHGTAPEPYTAVKRFLAGQLTAEMVIKQLEDADLVGMGGAAARTGKKWKDVRDARGDKRYLICNADESEPGTFKDRELLLNTPHLIVEGMLLAGLTLGAREREMRGYIYIRHEYHEQIAACQAAIERARRIVPEAALALCPLEVFTSPGLYICGEESALIEVIEGKRAQPRNQPPDIRNNGLFDEPTLVNNVETYAWVPSIILREPHDWYKKEPMRFFSLSGDVKKPGVYEVSFRTTFGELIEMAGGMVDGLKFYALAPSGPSGGFLPASLDGEQVRSILSEEAISSLERRSKLQGARVRLPPDVHRRLASPYSTCRSTCRCSAPWNSAWERAWSSTAPSPARSSTCSITRATCCNSSRRNRAANACRAGSAASSSSISPAESMAARFPWRRSIRSFASSPG